MEVSSTCRLASARLAATRQLRAAERVRLEAEAAGLAERLGNEESARAELVRDMGRYGEV